MGGASSADERLQKRVDEADGDGVRTGEPLAMLRAGAAEMDREP
jgi:hypothetical protein